MDWLHGQPQAVRMRAALEMVQACREIALDGVVRKEPERIGVLSARQGQVAMLLCFGYTVKEVAAKLDCAVKTVDTHRAATYRKLNVRNRVELMMALTRLDLRGMLPGTPAAPYEEEKENEDGTSTTGRSAFDRDKPPQSEHHNPGPQREDA